MKEIHDQKLSARELFEVGGLGRGNAQPLFSIGDTIFCRSNPSCFGRIIKIFFKSEKLMYRIMGSDPFPIDIPDGDAQLK